MLQSVVVGEEVLRVEYPGRDDAAPRSKRPACSDRLVRRPVEDKGGNHRPVAMLVLSFADAGPYRVGSHDRAGKQRMCGSDPGVDDADDGGAGDRGEHDGEPVRVGVVELGQVQRGDRQGVDARDDVELSEIVHGACCEVDPGEQEAGCVVDVAISDASATSFDGATELVDPPVCQGAVVGMPALDVEAKVGRRVHARERGPERWGDAVGRREGAQGVDGVEELRVRLGASSGARSGLQFVETLGKGGECRVVGEGDDHLRARAVDDGQAGTAQLVGIDGSVQIQDEHEVRVDAQHSGSCQVGHRDRACSLLKLSSMPGEVVMSARTRETGRLAAPVGGHCLGEAKEAEPVADSAVVHSREVLLARRRASSRSRP